MLHWCASRGNEDRVDIITYVHHFRDHITISRVGLSSFTDAASVFVDGLTLKVKKGADSPCDDSGRPRHAGVQNPGISKAPL